MQNKYKVGDKVRIKATNEEGEVTHVGGSVYPYRVKIGEHDYYAFREGELCDPAPVKVGEVLVTSYGEIKVLEVFENTILRSSFSNFDRADGFYTFKEIEEYGWKIKGKEESDKTQEAIDLLKSNGYQIIKK